MEVKLQRTDCSKLQSDLGIGQTRLKTTIWNIFWQVDVRITWPQDVEDAFWNIIDWPDVVDIGKTLMILKASLAQRIQRWRGRVELWSYHRTGVVTVAHCQGLTRAFPSVKGRLVLDDWQLPEKWRIFFLYYRHRWYPCTIVLHALCQCLQGASSWGFMVSERDINIRIVGAARELLGDGAARCDAGRRGAPLAA